jgi:hypothetical protein
LTEFVDAQWVLRNDPEFTLPGMLCNAPKLAMDSKHNPGYLLYFFADHNNKAAIEKCFVTSWQWHEKFMNNELTVA